MIIKGGKKENVLKYKSGNMRYWLTLITHLGDTEQLLHNLDFNNPKLSKSILNSSPPLYRQQKCIDLL